MMSRVRCGTLLCRFLILAFLFSLSESSLVAKRYHFHKVTHLTPTRFIATVVKPFIKRVELSNLALNTSLSEAHTACATREETTRLLVNEIRTC